MKKEFINGLQKSQNTKTRGYVTKQKQIKWYNSYMDEMLINSKSIHEKIKLESSVCNDVLVPKENT